MPFLVLNKFKQKSHHWRNLGAKPASLITKSTFHGRNSYLLLSREILIEKSERKNCSLSCNIVTECWKFSTKLGVPKVLP